MLTHRILYTLLAAAVALLVAGPALAEVAAPVDATDDIGYCQALKPAVSCLYYGCKGEVGGHARCGYYTCVGWTGVVCPYY